MTSQINKTIQSDQLNTKYKEIYIDDTHIDIEIFKSGFDLSFYQQLSNFVEANEKDRFSALETYKDSTSIRIPTLVYFLHASQTQYLYSRVVTERLLLFLWPVDDHFDNDFNLHESKIILANIVKDLFQLQEVTFPEENLQAKTVEKFKHIIEIGKLFKKECKKFNYGQNMPVLSKIISGWIDKVIEKINIENTSNISFKDYINIRRFDGAIYVCLAFCAIVEGQGELIDIDTYDNIAKLETISLQNDIWAENESFNAVEIIKDEGNTEEEAWEKILNICYTQLTRLKNLSIKTKNERLVQQFTLRWSISSFIWQFLAERYKNPTSERFVKWFLNGRIKKNKKKDNTV